MEIDLETRFTQLAYLDVTYLSYKFRPLFISIAAIQAKNVDHCFTLQDITQGDIYEPETVKEYLNYAIGKGFIAEKHKAKADFERLALMDR